MKRLFQQSNGEGERLLDKVIHQLKATPLFQMGDDKESDPSAISWEDEKEGLEKFCLFIKKELYPLLEPPFKNRSKCSIRRGFHFRYTHVHGCL